MKRLVKTVALGALLVSSSAYAVSIAACVGCHGQNFEKKAMGKSKVVKDMTKKEIVDSLKGYKAGTYGDTMKQMMVAQVKNLSDADIEAMSALIKGNTATKTEKVVAVVESGSAYIDLNKLASDNMRIESEDLGNRKIVSEQALGLRKTDLYSEFEETHGAKADYDRPAPGSSTLFERAYRDAPPMIPHSVEGLIPVTKSNNQCISCHMPETAAAMGATPIPPTHFANYRPITVLVKGEVLKEGKVVGKELGNSSDIVLAKVKQSDTLYQGRFNCTQCHAPQSKMKTSVANTFRPDYGDDKEKALSSLMDNMNDGFDIEIDEKASVAKSTK